LCILKLQKILQKQIPLPISQNKKTEENMHRSSLKNKEMRIDVLDFTTKLGVRERKKNTRYYLHKTHEDKEFLLLPSQMCSSLHIYIYLSLYSDF